MPIKISPQALAEELIARKRQGLHATREAAYLAAHRGRGHLASKTPVDRGQMKNAWQVHKNPTGAVLANSAPYAGIIEMGARPHPVSREGYEAIYGWVYRNRNFFGYTTKTGRRKTVQGRGWQAGGRGGGEIWVEDPGLAKIARAIVWKLKKEGQKPTYFVRNEIDNLKLFLNEQTRIAFAKRAKSRARGRER